MTASFAQLQRRCEKLKEELERKKEQLDLFGGGKLKTNLPGVDRWVDFARLTWIRTRGKIAPFEPWDCQIDLVNKINSSSNIIINKSRQMGISETVICYLACRMLTERGFAAVVISKTQLDSSELATRIRQMLNSIQGEKFDYTTDSNTKIAIKGRGVIYFLPSSARAARGIPSCCVLFIDEAAFQEDPGGIYRGAEPTLSMVPDAKVIVNSTPDIEMDWYGQKWLENIPSDWYDYVLTRQFEALNQKLALINDDWTRVAIHYSQSPVYSVDPDWAEKKRKSRKIPQSVFNSEYELSFGQTDSQIYPSSLVQRAARGHWRECGSINRTYVMAVDPNGGGSDYFVAIVMDITQTPYEVVGMYRQNGRSTEYSLKHVKALIEDYMPTRVIVEKQAMGHVIAEALQIVLPSYAIEEFNTTRPSKNTATDRTLFLLESDELIFPDGEIANELRAFKLYESGERKAAPNFNDDTVMALAMACSLVTETPNASLLFNNI